MQIRVTTIQKKDCLNKVKIEYYDLASYTQLVLECKGYCNVEFQYNKNFVTIIDYNVVYICEF